MLYSFLSVSLFAGLSIAAPAALVARDPQDMLANACSYSLVQTFEATGTKMFYTSMSVSKVIDPVNKPNGDLVGFEQRAADNSTTNLLDGAMSLEVLGQTLTLAAAGTANANGVRNDITLSYKGSDPLSAPWPNQGATSLGGSFPGLENTQWRTATGRFAC